MSTALVRRCDLCDVLIPEAAPVLVLSRFDLQRAGGEPVTIPRPVDVCSAACFTTLTQRLFDAAMSAPFGVAPVVDPSAAPEHPNAGARRA